MMDRLRAFVPKRAPAPPDPPNVTVPASLVRSAHVAAWLAYFCLVYFLWLYTLDIARDRAEALHLTHVGAWVGDLQFWFPLIIGFAVVSVGIPYVAKIAIPTFMSLTWREAFWPKAWALFIAVAVSLVVLAGTFTVQGDAILERERDSSVAVDRVAQEAAVQTARIADVQHRLDEMTGSNDPYVRVASSMTPAAYERWVEARRGDWQYERFVAHRETSAEAERLRNEMTRLREEQAVQTVASEVVGRVETERTGWISATLGWLEGARAMLLSAVMDIVCLLMPWIALRLEQARNRQLAAADFKASIDDAHMIPDLRSETAPEPQPMDPPREVVRDAETGEELVRVRPKAYWRKRKGQKQEVNVAPEPMPDDVGFPDAARTAMSTEAMMASGAMAAEADTAREPVQEPAAEPASSDSEDGEHQAPGEDEAALWEALAAEEAPAEETETELPNKEGVMVRETEDA